MADFVGILICFFAILFLFMMFAYYIGPFFMRFIVRFILYLYKLTEEKTVIIWSFILFVATLIYVWEHVFVQLLHNH